MPSVGYKGQSYSNCDNHMGQYKCAYGVMPLPSARHRGGKNVCKKGKPRKRKKGIGKERFETTSERHPRVGGMLKCMRDRSTITEVIDSATTQELVFEYDRAQKQGKVTSQHRNVNPLSNQNKRAGHQQQIH